MWSAILKKLSERRVKNFIFMFFDENIENNEHFGTGYILIQG
jgi:hypothetical protein